MQPKSKLGVVGMGAIAQAVVRAIDDGQLPFTISAVYHRNSDRSAEFRRSLRHPPAVTSLADLVASSDLILEAASRPAVEEICRAAFPKGKDVIVVSVGALLEKPYLLDLARESGCRIFAPSGGMIGLDGLTGAAVGEIKSVTITTRKSPGSLRNTPYVKERGLDMDRVTMPTVIFDGSPIDALKSFPSNINVSAAVSLAGIGAERTRLKIVADPDAQRNIHEVETIGEFGRSFIRIENVPAGGKGPGMLSYLSVIAFLKQYGRPLAIGT